MLSRVICLVLLAGAAHAALNDGCDPSVAGQCSDVANSHCDETSFTCVCDDRYLETSTGKCDGVLGRSCNVDWSATCNKVPYALCLGPTCECSREYVNSDTKTACWVPTYGAHCLEDLQCGGLGEAECVDEKCVCKSGYSSNGVGACYPNANGLDEQCDVNNQCHGYDQHAECVLTVQGNRCKCRGGFVHNAANTACVENAHQVGDSCDVAEQCSNFDFNSECSGGSCQCASGYVSSIDGVNCISQISLDDGCQQEQQCSSFVTNSDCIEGQCQCKSGYINEGGVCNPARRFSRRH